MIPEQDHGIQSLAQEPVHLPAGVPSGTGTTRELLRSQGWFNGVMTTTPQGPGRSQTSRGRRGERPEAAGGGWAPRARARGTRSRRRSAIAGAAAVLVAGGSAGVVLPGLAGASSPPKLAAVSARSLLRHVADARVAHLSGTIVTQSALGLPASLSSLLGSGAATGAQSSSPGASLLSGSTTERVWVGGPGLLRVAVFGQGSEKDLVVGHRSAWLWDSTSQSALKLQPSPLLASKLHGAIRAGGRSARGGDLAGGRGAVALSPSAAAAGVLAAVRPSTAVGVGPATWVAGRAAYQLTVRPRLASSLVSEAVVEVDARTWLPLGVKVFARGQSVPAFSVAYSRISFAAPDPSYFRFVPPPGAKVRHAVVPRSGSGPTTLPPLAGPAPRGSAGHRPPTFGSGWGTVVELPSSVGTGPQVKALLASAPVVRGKWGSGRLVSSAVVDALVLPSGHVLVGAVSPSSLESVASRLP